MLHDDFLVNVWSIANTNEETKQPALWPKRQSMFKERNTKVSLRRVTMK